MNLYIDFMVALFMEAARLFVNKLYVDIFFEKKKNTLFFYGISYFLTTATYLLFHSSFLNLLTTLIGMLIVMMGYYGSLKKKILIMLIIVAISVGFDIVAVYLISASPKGNNYSIISSFLSVVLLLLGAVVVKGFIRKEIEDFSFREWWPIVFILIINIVTLFIIYRDSMVSRNSTLWIGITMIILDFVVIKLYENILDKYKLEFEQGLLREQMKVYENQQKNHIESARKIASIRHDMKNHLNEIAILAHQGENRKIETYISQMNDYISVPNVLRTNNDNIDGIINYKIQNAISKGIKVTTNIAVPETLDLSSFDMNVIFGNIFDNAIETSFGKEDAFINLIVKYRVGCMIIKMENNADKEIERDRFGRIFSSKGKEKRYGIGLENVKRVVEKYHGELKTQMSNGIFFIDIIIFIE